jgi:hypothetical protein
MNWKVIAPLAILGPLMGVLTVLGQFPAGVDRFAWCAVVLTSAFYVARRDPAHAVKHGAVIGFWNGATSTLVQALFVKQLVANNPWMAARFAHAPHGFDMQFFVYMLVPFIGVTGGALTALVAMLLRRALAAARERGKRGETSP